MKVKKDDLFGGVGEFGKKPRAVLCHLSYVTFMSGNVRQSDKQLYAWCQICGGGKGWFQYADDVCLMANSEEDMNVIMEKLN